MNNIILFDDESWDNLLPLTFTRPVCELRVGILTIREKWEKGLEGKSSYITQEYLSERYPIEIEKDNLVINGSVLPDDNLRFAVLSLENNEALLKDGQLIAARLNEEQFHSLMENQEIEELKGYELEDFNLQKIRYPWDIFRLNSWALQIDFDWITLGRKSKPISATNHVFGIENVFLEEGAVVECAVINATNGPVYIGKNALIMEGCLIRDGLALCEGAQLKMGTKIYGATTIGPWSKIGGEVNNSVILGYTNKAHDGFLGNSVLGEWCNLGADTNNSNLKNNYSQVRVWQYPQQEYRDTGLQFCGLIMGDHSKCGINTMFNTGTVVGVFANIAGGGYPSTFIPSFSWLAGDKSEEYDFEKAMEVARKTMSRRQIELSASYVKVLEHIFKETKSRRKS